MTLNISVPGNYPIECWNPNKNSELSEEEGLPLILVDMHGFNKACESFTPKDLYLFMSGYFSKIAGVYSSLKNDFHINKYMGDVILATYSLQGLDKLITRSSFFMSQFLSDTEILSEKYGFNFNVRTIIGKASCVRGGIGSSLYYDHSYWGKEVNEFFWLTKNREVDEGYIWITDDLLNSVSEEQRSDIMDMHMLIRKEIENGYNKLIIWGKNVEV